MDPSYDNSGQDFADIPGAKSGIIASGPDVPEPVVPQSVNNVVLDGGGGPQKSKKGLIAAGVTLIGVALVVGIVALIMMTGNNSGDSTKTKDVINLASFNRLINYVVSGEEVDTALNGDYNTNGNYYLLEQDGNEKTEVYKKTGELLKDFVADYTANYTEGQEENEHRARITALVDSTADMFEFLNVMDFTDKVYGYQIREMGRDKALAYYKFMGLKDNSYVTDFTEAYTEWVDALFSNSDMINEAYRNVLSYYDMTSDFVASLFGINDLMKDEAMTEGISE